jgi:hypothetical protein
MAVVRQYVLQYIVGADPSVLDAKASHRKNLERHAIVCQFIIIIMLPYSNLCFTLDL